MFNHTSKMIALSITIAGMLLISCGKEPPHFLPEQINNLKLEKKMLGEEAKNFVNKLHFQSVASEKNEIGFYQGEEGKATIYVTHYNSSEKAREDWKRMTEKISPKNSVFIGGDHFKVKGRMIYRCFGMGQTHFVFTNEKQLFWISVNTMIGQKILSAYLDYLG
ncbi:MAG: hypothetical protein Kow0042_13120 [Calditrichia bacterium]